MWWRYVVVVQSDCRRHVAPNFIGFEFGLARHLLENNLPLDSETTAFFCPLAESKSEGHTNKGLEAGCQHIGKSMEDMAISENYL